MVRVSVAYGGIKGEGVIDADFDFVAPPRLGERVDFIQGHSHGPLWVSQVIHFAAATKTAFETEPVMRVFLTNMPPDEERPA